MKVRQGRSSMWVPAPVVDFSSLSSEYIGILYEGLLDFELKTAPARDPVVFLAVGNQPALPLSHLPDMDDKALKALLEKMKDTSKESDTGEDESASGDGEAEDAAAGADDDTLLADAAEGDQPDEPEEAPEDDERHATRSRAETWARKAVEVGRLVSRKKGKATPDGAAAYEEDVARKARQLVSRVVLPGEWYLVRWGGTRKGAGTFYTRPGLAVPAPCSGHRPLAQDPPSKTDGTPDPDASAAAGRRSVPRTSLALKVCDPAMRLGAFPCRRCAS
ncbi:MAG: hypothetical protein R2712_12345 [Vicinamibacterales bacterium]